MVTLIKDGGVKYLSDDSSLIPDLKKDGWVCEGEEISPDIEALKEEANKLGLKYHHRCSYETIKKLIEEAQK